MNTSILSNVEGVLSRNEMKHIVAGSGGQCRAYSTTFGWSDFCTSVETAQYEYENNESITGYCCASCGSGSFQNAAPCNTEPGVSD